jgi:hypothetical protein
MATSPTRTKTRSSMPVVAEHDTHDNDTDDDTHPSPNDDTATPTVRPVMTTRPATTTTTTSNNNKTPTRPETTSEIGGSDENDGMTEDDYEANADISRGVRVIVRVRPSLSHEAGAPTTLLRVHDNDNDNDNDGSSHSSGLQSISLRAMGSGAGGGEADHKFAFDSVLSTSANQSSVYEAGQIDHMLNAVLRGSVTLLR